MFSYPTRYLITALLGFSFALFSFQIAAQEVPDNNGVTCTDIAVDGFGNTYICGYFHGFVSFGRSRLKSKNASTDIFLAKYSKDGENIWAVRAGGEATDVAQSIAVDSKGQVYMTGNFQDYADFEHRKIESRGQNDIFLARYNASGGINLLKTFGGRGSEESVALEVDAADNIYLAGNFNDRFSFSGKSVNTIGETSLFIGKMSKRGSTEWVKTMGDNSGRVLLNDLSVDPSGNVFLAGGFSDLLLVGEQKLKTKGELDGFIVNLSTTGGLRYVKLYGTPATDFARSICSDGSGNAIVIGHTIQGMSAKQGFVYKVDKTGKIGQKETWNIGYETSFQDVLMSKGGDIVICGTFSEFEQFENIPVNSSGTDGFVLNCSRDLTPQWGFASGDKMSGKADVLALGLNGEVHVGLNRPRKKGYYEQAVFLAKINQSSALVWSNQVGAAERTESFDPSSIYVDFKGKLLMGSETLQPVVAGDVELLDETGTVLEATKTDEYGDFTFHNLNTKNEYSIKAPDAKEKAGTEPVYIANQSGMILGEMSDDGEAQFKYKILPAQLNEIAVMETSDTEFKVEKFLASDVSEAIIDMQIYYEPGAFQIPSAYEQELKNIARKLRSQRDISIEVASYTDAIGDAEENMKLSNKRAREIVNFMVSRKVSDDMISGKGYGETGIVNRCKDGVTDCSDREHQANRRTEIRLNREG